GWSAWHGFRGAGRTTIRKRMSPGAGTPPVRTAARRTAARCAVARPTAARRTAARCAVARPTAARRTVARRIEARRTAAMRTVARRIEARRTAAMRTVARRTAAGRTAARPPGSGPGGEPPGRGGAAAGAGNELERHLIAWLDAVEKGHLVEALSLAEEVPGEAGARLRRVSEAWNRRLLDLQTSVSRAVEQGARPLIASSSLAEATRLLDDQTNQLAALSEE